MNRILIVEGQSQVVTALECALREISPRYLGNAGFDVSRDFSCAQRRIANESYGLVILDHRIPKCDVGDLDERDFADYCARLESIGYFLIGQIKSRNPAAIVIGTMKVSPAELNGWLMPDYFISKTRAEAETQLDTILSNIQFE